jgi:dextranase
MNKIRHFIVFTELFILFTYVYAAGIIESIKTDKARYTPGTPVTFTVTVSGAAENSNLYVKYLYLYRTMATHTISSVTGGALSWTWQPPSEDFKGYLVEIQLLSDTLQVDQTTIAVDVSSDWTRFPRYGFLSKFPLLNQESIENMIAQLNRYHINGLQFYDWHYKHHMPLSGTPENPATSWPDIANRTNYFTTIELYIRTAHRFNMNTMAYNLLYGALENAGQDGVSEEWCLFTDAAHSGKDFMDLSFWGHYIYLMDPHNQAWKNYIFNQMNKVFQVFDFDGWHIDQLGDRGSRWNYQGQPVVIKDAFTSYITEAKNALTIPLVMNAVNQYGQEAIAVSPVDFLYTEVWDPNTTFDHLAQIIIDNHNFSNHTLNTVLAAYINHDLSDNPGWFNPPAVLLADAVIFAFGGAHLELGEHMLGHEYFPNDNLRITDDLRQKLIAYYDFLVAYQNILRDGGVFSDYTLSATGAVTVTAWPPRRGEIAVVSKRVDSRHVYHLLNFVNANSLDWRDNSGTQNEPSVIQDLPLSFESTDAVVHLWAASPDSENGAPIDLPFVQQDNTVTFTLPVIKYWTMVVVEYESWRPPSTDANDGPCKDIFILENNAPNPARHSTTLRYTLNTSAEVTLKVYNLLGQVVQTLVHKEQAAGTYLLDYNTAGLPSGLYFYTLQTPTCRQTKKIVIIQ